MELKFNPQDITMSEVVSGVQRDKGEDPRIEALEDLQARVEDDFDYVIAGIERLTREGMIDDAINGIDSVVPVTSLNAYITLSSGVNLKALKRSSLGGQQI